SAATGHALRSRLGRPSPPIVVAPLGVDLPAIGDALIPEHPYFITIGTIEARKNLDLLLDVWQRLAAELGPRTPRLVLAGRRGFGGEQIGARLNALPGTVVEH